MRRVFCRAAILIFSKFENSTLYPNVCSTAFMFQIFPKCLQFWMDWHWSYPSELDYIYRFPTDYSMKKGFVVKQISRSVPIETFPRNALVTKSFFDWKGSKSYLLWKIIKSVRLFQQSFRVKCSRISCFGGRKQLGKYSDSRNLSWKTREKVGKVGSNSQQIHQH